MKNKVLILTDHTNHSSENSLYELSVKMHAHLQTEYVDIATRANPKNKAFFSCGLNFELWATRIKSDFAYHSENHPLQKDDRLINLDDYDLIWLRLPPPLSSSFLDFIDQVCSGSVTINNPSSIQKTGSKKFLLNFPELCPPMMNCTSIQHINAFRKQFPIVLKPYNEYGGRGIVKIVNELVSSGTDTWSFDEFANNYQKHPVDYLGVKYLQNISQGDKRIVIVNGQILGASLRLPAANSWLCNVSMGGSSNRAEVAPEEEAIVNRINPILQEMGIAMYGVDTLVNDDGKRVLSEINTTSIGGLPQIAKMQNEPLVEKAIDLIWDFYNQKRKENA